MNTLVIAPHPDDELLGCGGTLLRRIAEGGTVGWLLMTAIHEQDGWPAARVQARAAEIEQVREGLNIAPEHHFALGLPTTQLDQIPMATLIERIAAVFKTFQPEEVLLPHPGDVHSDHRITFEAAMACTKWFRYPSVRRVLTYETPSETDFTLNPCALPFQPTVLIDISEQLERKLSLLQVYASELGAFPFPRSDTAVRALAQLRGAQAGSKAAEGFVLLRERQGIET